MKKISFWLNIVLVLAVAVLFYLHFQPDTLKGDSAEKKQSEEQTRKAFNNYDHLRVAFVNIDSLLAGYDMYVDKRDEFIEDQSSSQAELQSRSQELQREFNELKEKLNKGLITRAKARMMQQNLGQKEQKLYQLRQNMSSELAEKEQVIYRQVLNNIMDYLDDYADEKGYHYILSYSFGGPLLYKSDQFDITENVLSGLNNAYAQNQEAEN